MFAGSDALAHYLAGRVIEAERVAASVLLRIPRDRIALTVLGLIRLSARNYKAAIPLFRRIVRYNDSDIAGWVNLGLALRATGSLAEALVAYEKAQSLGESSANFLFNFGLALFDLEEFIRSLALFRSAQQQSPGDDEILYYYAQTCYECVLMEEARTAIRNWHYNSKLDLELVAKFSTLLMQLGEADRAESTIRAALLSNPSDPLINLRLAQIAERNNQLEQAQSICESIGEQKAVESGLDVEFASMRALLAQRAGRYHEAERGLNRVLSETRKDPDRVSLLFQSGKVQDALGNFDRAFAFFCEAHSTQTKLLARSSERFEEAKRDAMPIVNYGCSVDDLSRWCLEEAPSLEESPIFIVAFPRSGTTLLEQVLDAHPSLQSMDEQPYLQQAIDRMQLLGAKYPEELAQLVPAQISEVRDYYWSLVAQQVQLRSGQRLVDKNPLNLLRLPAIHRLFPNARILLAIRHPLDVILSCFMQHFRAPEFAILCRSIESLALAYRRAFEFWYAQNEMIKADCLELKYEDFVSNFEASVQTIADFIQVPLDDVMLNPAAHARTRGFISTPSYSQVVKPVNKGAIGRWQNYEKYLQDALPEVIQLLSRWDYAIPAM